MTEDAESVQDGDDLHNDAPNQSSPTRSWAPFLAVEAGTVLSGIGNGITMIALPWLVLERTGSATAAGVLAAITALPTMVSALLSGTIVDRVGRRKVSVVSDLLSLVSVALIPVVDRALGLDFLWLAVLAILGAVFDPAGMGARESMVPEAARSARLSLARANGIHEAVWGGAFVIGPALGGLLISLVGAATTFWVTAGMFAASALVIAIVRIPGGQSPEPADEGFWEATGQGVLFVWNDRLLRTLAILMMLLVAFWLPVEGVLLPVFYEAIDAPDQLGLVLMGLSLGAIGGALSYGALGQRISTRTLFLVGLILTGFGIAAMSTLPPVAPMTIFAFLTGLAFGPVQPIMNVAMQSRTPSRLRGRVVGMLTAVQYAAGPFGFLLVGPLVDGVGIEWAFPIVAGFMILICFSALAMGSLRELNDLDPHKSPPLEETQPPRPMS